ncbi:hypothetical protein Sme01_22970 [Sphaerisporangium melleum]|uniref:Secreted protein n=1 Tax=Sphaerisporangium melleum TaxID=321316 RepID=A0A917QYS9_9ACTN|nr:DUF6454 family protein [Sphaerisporangium melleum]GGK78382.1 hypothetical protein GCM10007964_21400 [Sphaerisporangium melleum]GII69821.1 hypothetical protein Sme01_22970 [Sphaerisporangium melleum]
MRLGMKRRLLLSLSLAAAVIAGTSAIASAADDRHDNGHPARDGATAQLLTKVARGTSWTQSAAPLKLNFETYHPQGMLRVGDRYYMSSVEIIKPTTPCNPACDGYDRTPGEGLGHLFEYDQAGNLLRDLTFKDGNAYHPGGIDYDGRYLWIPVAEYRPNSKAIVYKVDLAKFRATEVLRVDDHIGGVVHDQKNNRLVGISWGSRTFYTWNMDGRLKRTAKNPEQFTDFQDCDYLAEGKAACTGVASLNVGGQSFQLGGISLLDLDSLTAINTVPVTALSAAGNSITRNPTWIEAKGNALQLTAVPDDSQSTLLTYTTPALS